MKSTGLDFLCHTRTAAPALNRGLAVLALLCNQPALSLDKLTVQLRLPKASVYRLLETLQQIGMVRKTLDKHYEPLWTLQPLDEPRALYRQAIEKRMNVLCADTGCTVEWYEPAAKGMILTHQKNPDSELCVQAKPGFVREWGKEFEAVIRLGYAFAEEAPPVSSFSMYVSNGVKKTIPVAQVRAWITDARVRRAGHDAPFNANGVRRYAAAAFDETGKTFFGVLALAERCHFSRRSGAKAFLKQLHETLKPPLI